MIRIAIILLVVCAAVGCAKQDKASTTSPDQSPPQAEHGPAEKDASIVSGLAEEFMKAQPDAKRYSSRATAVFQEEIGVYIVRFRLLDNSSKNAALVNVVLKDKRCERVLVK
jgi:hypothetical protein